MTKQRCESCSAIAPRPSNTGVHALILTIFDTGCRITELLTAAVTDFDFDNLLLTVYGKGRKERRVPMSIELGRTLFRWGRVKERAEVTSSLMFPTRDSHPRA